MDKKTIALEEFTKLLAKAKKGKESLAVVVNGERINVSGLSEGRDLEAKATPYAWKPDTMEVVSVFEEDKVCFDNGCVIEAYHNQDCCENNYLDFSQFKKGMVFPAICEPADAEKHIHLREDGLYMVTTSGLPIWAQARSIQNGYYSFRVGVMVTFAPHYLMQVEGAGSSDEPMVGMEDEDE